MNILLICFFGIFTANYAHAAAFDELTPDQQAVVQHGDQVVITVDDPSSAFPKTYIYQKIDASPEECLAVVTDFELQSSYSPNMVKSEISKQIDKRTVQVDYSIAMPFPMSKENYTTQFHFDSYNNGASYRSSWTLVRADSSKDTTGNSRYENLGTGTLMAYYNFIIPNSKFADRFKARAVRQMVDATAALKKQIEEEKDSNRTLLQKQIEILRAAFSS